jgi:hypothetical protein
MQERFKQKKRKVYPLFVALEKSFDRVPRGVIEWDLRRYGMAERLIILTMSLYLETKSQVRTVTWSSENFAITVVVHQGSALIPLFFIIVLEEATCCDRRMLSEMAGQSE